MLYDPAVDVSLGYAVVTLQHCHFGFSIRSHKGRLVLTLSRKPCECSTL